MIEKPVDTITKEDLEALAEAAVGERRTLDYKEELPGSSDRARKEFLGDVASFANAAGGDLLFGVQDIRTPEGEPTGTPELLGLGRFNADGDVQRLENMIRTGIAPRVSGVQYGVIEGFPRGPILVLRVPRSWGSLHMVTFQEHSRFYTRNARGRYPMDVHEVRAGFLMREALPERVRRFRDERIGRILAREMPIELDSKGCTVLHLVPASAFDAPDRLDVRSLGRLLGRLAPMRPRHAATGWDGRFNLDGFMTYAGTMTYAQIMRHGVIEAVDSTPYGKSDRDAAVFSEDFETALVDGVQGYLEVMSSELRIDPPVFVFVSIVGVEGYRLAVDNRAMIIRAPQRVDRDVLLLPDVLVEDYAAASAAALLRAPIDALWQAAGHPGSPNYDGAGKWRFE